MPGRQESVFTLEIITHNHPKTSLLSTHPYYESSRWPVLKENVNYVRIARVKSIVRISKREHGQ